MSSRPYKRQAQVGQWHDTRAAYTRRRPRLNSDCVLVIMEFLKHSSAASYLANLMLVCKEYHFLGMPFYVNHPQVYTRKYSEKSIRTWHWFLSRRYTVDRLRSDLVLDIIIYRPNLPDRPRDLPPLQFSTIVSLLKDRKDRLRSLTLTDIEELFLLDTEGDLFNAIKSLRALQTFHITCGYARTLELLPVLEAPVRRLQIEFIDRIIWPVPAINMDMIGALSRHSNSLTTIDFSGSYCEVVHSPRTVLPLVRDLRLTVSNVGNMWDTLHCFPNLSSLQLRFRSFQFSVQSSVYQTVDDYQAAKRSRERARECNYSFPHLQRLDGDINLLWALGLQQPLKCLRVTHLSYMGEMLRREMKSEMMRQLLEVMKDLCSTPISTHLGLSLRCWVLTSDDDSRPVDRKVLSKNFRDLIRSMPYVEVIDFTLVGMGKGIDSFDLLYDTFCDSLKYKLKSLNGVRGKPPKDFLDINMQIRPLPYEYFDDKQSKMAYHDPATPHQRARPIMASCPKLRFLRLEIMKMDMIIQQGNYIVYTWDGKKQWTSQEPYFKRHIRL